MASDAAGFTGTVVNLTAGSNMRFLAVETDNIGVKGQGDRVPSRICGGDHPLTGADVVTLFPERGGRQNQRNKNRD